MDELGVPFGVTVDFQTAEDQTVTLRERDSMAQIRMPLSDVAPLIARLVREEATWKVRVLREGASAWAGLVWSSIDGACAGAVLFVFCMLGAGSVIVLFVLFFVGVGVAVRVAVVVFVVGVDEDTVCLLYTSDAADE